MNRTEHRVVLGSNRSHPPMPIARLYAQMPKASPVSGRAQTSMQPVARALLVRPSPTRQPGFLTKQRNPREVTFFLAAVVVVGLTVYEIAEQTRDALNSLNNSTKTFLKLKM